MIISREDAINLLSSLPEYAKINHRETHAGGMMLVVTMNKSDLIRDKFPALVGQAITVTEAANRYSIPRDTILEWVNKGYLRVITPGYRMTIDNSDIAYCAEVYHTRKTSGVGFRAPLLDNNGLPYILKHPDLSAYRRRRKEN